MTVLAPVTILAAADAAFHLEAHAFGLVGYAMRLAVATILTLLMLIAGRIVPSFTRNWLARENPGRLPTPFGKFDAAAISISTAALCVWVVAPSDTITAAALFTAGILQLARLARWAGERAARESLVLILHVAYAFVPAGFILTALAASSGIQPSAGFHAWTTGAVGIMTLAVMTRAALGHTGRQLSATTGTQAIYAAVVLAALTRVAAALSNTWTIPLLHLAAFAWIAAFAGFALLYAPLLFRARQ